MFDKSKYHTVDGLINNDCVFIGNPLFVPYYHDLAMRGQSEDIFFNAKTNTMGDVFMIMPEDVSHFPELAPYEGQYILVSSDYFGLVWYEIVHSYKWQ